MVILTLPFPPSTNRLWRHWQGRTLISREGRVYRATVGQIVAVAIPPMPAVQSVRHRMTARTVAMMRALTHTAARKPSQVRLRTRRASTAARQCARNQPCLIRLPGCLHDATTTVLCHYNLMGYHGMGLKAPDDMGAYGCANCHAVVDGRMARPAGYTRNDVRLAHAEGVMRTWILRGGA